MEKYPLLQGDQNWRSLKRNYSQPDLPAWPHHIDVPPAALTDEPGLGLVEHCRMLRRHKGMLFLVAIAGLGCAVLLTILQTPVYQARAVLEVQNLNENFLNMRDVSPTAGEREVPPGYEIQTQVNILQSESVLKLVAAKLDLATRLAAQQKNSHLAVWLDALGFPKPQTALSEDAVLRRLAANLTVSPEANTRLVEILYDSPDPVLAASIANALTAEYMRLNLESRWQATQKTGEWLSGRMEDVRIKLKKSEDQLQAYAGASGLVFTSERDNVADEKLRQLQQELSKAHADRIAKQSQYVQATTASVDSLPELLDDATLRDYRAKVTDLRRQLAELSSTLTPSHPSVAKIQAQVTTLEAAMEKERADVTRRIQNEFESAQRRERMLAASYDVQAGVIAGQAAKVAHYNLLKREVDNNRQLYDFMLQKVKEAGIASAINASNVHVVDPARPPAAPYKPNLPLNSMLGILGGCLIGTLIVIVRERADRSIQAPGEVSHYFAVPELGAILSAKAERNRSFAYFFQARSAAEKKTDNENWHSPVELAIWRRNPSALAESFRSALVSILYAGENGALPRVIALTSAGPGEGKTTVASNLALALAEIGRQVLLIDGDLRKPRLHEVFDVGNSWGLSDLLEGTKPLDGSEAMVVETGYRGLYVLPAGSAASSVANLLHSPRALELLQRLRKEFDMVIIDTPPLLQIPDARVLGRLADGVILVVRSARTTKENATAAMQRLADDGTRLLGTVLNEWDPQKTTRGSYEGGYPLQYQYYREHQPGGSRTSAHSAAVPRISL